MLGMIRYLSMTKIEVDQAISKDKLPKGKATGDVLKKALEVFLARLSQYATTIKVCTPSTIRPIIARYELLCDCFLRKTRWP